MALTTLLSDLASAVKSGAIDPATSQSIDNQALKALTDSSAGNLPQAATDLQQAVTTVANAVTNGSLSAQVGQTLQNDLVALATSLGLSASTNVPTTAPPPVNGGHGNGKGLGH